MDITIRFGYAICRINEIKGNSRYVMIGTLADSSKCTGSRLSNGEQDARSLSGRSSPGELISRRLSFADWDIVAPFRHVRAPQTQKDVL
jgi:hypothetical protein